MKRHPLATGQKVPGIQGPGPSAPAEPYPKAEIDHVTDATDQDKFKDGGEWQPDQAGNWPA